MNEIARKFEAAVEVIEQDRCPNDAAALVRMPQRSGWRVCATCGIGWRTHRGSRRTIIGQLAGEYHYVWLSTGGGSRYEDAPDGESWPVQPSLGLVPFLVQVEER
jgi:hypothetical protein